MGKDMKEILKIMLLKVLEFLKELMEKFIRENGVKILWMDGGLVNLLIMNIMRDSGKMD
jgi:hypothetical protein